MSVPNLVLVPGLLCTEALFSHQLRYLADCARITVPDVTGAETIDGLADAVLDQAPSEFALCGLSMGGIVSHAIMRRAPGRVTRLALLDTTARTETPEQTERRQALLDMTDSGQFELIHERLLPALVHPDRLGDKDLDDAIRSMALEIGPEAFRRQIAAIIGRPEALPALPTYEVPTLVLCGREDAITPLEFHEEMAAAIPGARLAVIEQCGHMSTMERPQAVTALLRLWLEYR